ncbi:hypothetical protein PBCV1_a311R [Paramecium bursaria Chlorella virus 1]|uniref:Uncharacterized protein n=1 Tax=Paramecium bursaria Chlorella virus 1 TaxID=10506 RepID=Q84627_PBCV1|nr:hypothetical protein PBCV1_a311R [Paramecium bursaria Chlorella virus 1]AAC96679.1 hypothetical protein [Paramecium bursaria Chlorella virus 1]
MKECSLPAGIVRTFPLASFSFILSLSIVATGFCNGTLGKEEVIVSAKKTLPVPAIDKGIFASAKLTPPDGEVESIELSLSMSR